jgi:hypothetical protein
MEAHSQLAPSGADDLMNGFNQGIPQQGLLDDGDGGFPGALA